MKPNPIPVTAALLLLGFSLAAQIVPPAEIGERRYEILLKSGAFLPEKNITAEKLERFNRIALRSSGKSFAVIQFEHIPTVEEKKSLAQSGIQLLDYIPNNAYTVTITGQLNNALMARLKARAVIDLAPRQKMHPELAKGRVPAWAIKIAGTLDVLVSFPKSFSYATVKQELAIRNFDLISDLYKDYRVIAIRLSMARLDELASLPFIEYVEPAPHEEQPLNNKSTANSRAHVLNSFLPGGRRLRGDSVVIGVGDDSDPLRHVDFTGRMINRAAVAGGTHGVHVQGIIAGGGINYEIFTGAAPKATLIAQTSSNIILNAAAYVQDYGMVITNNSYGDVINDCSSFGSYTLVSRILDQQALELPQLQHVFAAGNSAVFNCSPYPNSYGTVLGDFQAAKNTIDVGSTSAAGVADGFSSRGPVKDGRIKPELAAQGISVGSTWPVNTYNYDTGTSMAAPAVAGGLALLLQRYRQLHGYATPKSGLMKALLCNGATDIGRKGPDYVYGFGWMNLLRSVQMLENNSYRNDSVANGGTKTFTITIPANTARLKVMLYWNDPAAAVLAAHTLVNDLDLEVVNPSLQTILPLILDTVPTKVADTAAAAADHINNIEQVVIANPVPGTYTVNVKGTAITQNPQQEFFLVYDSIPVSTTLVHPIGGERFNGGLPVYISWDSDGDTTSTFKLEYETNNAGPWTVIDGSVNAKLRLLAWNVPSVITEQGRVRITNNGTGVVQTSEPFIISEIPTPSLALIQCEDYFGLNWTKVTGATDYEVMMLKGDEMVSVGTTLDTNFVVGGLSKDTVYWAAVRARINGVPARRSMAIFRQPNSGTCTGTISDNDIKMDSLISPGASGRKFTSTELSNAVPITIRIKNLDDVATTQDITVSYKINSNPAIPFTITNPAIGAGQVLNYTFSTNANLSAVGSDTIQLIIFQTTDPNRQNDTLIKIIKQLDNPPITGLSTPFVDDMETAAPQTVLKKQMGLDGLERYDFVNSTVNGRLRTFVNTGIAYSGSKALTLDADRSTTGNTDSLTGTFNLATYNAAVDDIRFDFLYKNHGQLANAANKVWIRGNDQQNWVEVYNLFANQYPVNGLYKRITGIELTDSLLAHGQNFSSSFQVRWGQWGKMLAADNYGGAGYSFDDVRLYSVTNDIQMVSIDTPLVVSCALSANTPVTISVRNSANTTVTGVPVAMKVDGVDVLPTEILPDIPANTTIQYTFTATANLLAPGVHTVQAWVELLSDSYHANDTAIVTLVNSPVVTVTSANPYLQDFESSSGSWYTAGYNDSWEYGTPASSKINRAASGSKAWKTSIAGTYNELEFSYLYSPCFDISSMSVPTLSFSVALDLEDCGGVFCDGAYMEYSRDGKTWQRLGGYGQGTNWYNKNYTSNNLWSVQNYHRWHVATIPLPTSGLLSQLRLRFVVSTDISVNRDGIAVDDIHIYDNVNGIYTGATMGAPVTANVPGGANWVNFTSGGKLIASVRSPGQAMGNTNAQAYINTAAVRNAHSQYYHNRNITIKPATNSLSDSASVRFYFLDSETEALIAATGCPGCTKPTMAYELGVSKYNNVDAFYEDGDIANNVGGNWLFIDAAKAVKVPFDKGYYAEFKVKDFSEFWLNNGGFGHDQVLPVQLVSFTATRTGNNVVMTEWVTASELNVDHYEVEVARGNAGYQRNQFAKLGEINSRGNSTQREEYRFADDEDNKTGIRFYRLKIINSDGSFQYSAVRPVVFNEEITWQVYPNPSHGMFNLVYQANDGEALTVTVYGVNGKTVKQYHLLANGFVQKLAVDLQGTGFANGLYLVEAAAGEKKQMFRLIKQ